jgi:hypothetical protein
MPRQRRKLRCVEAYSLFLGACVPYATVKCSAGRICARSYLQQINIAGQQRDSNGWSAVAGSTLELSGVSKLEGFVGYTQQNYFNPGIINPRDKRRRLPAYGRFLPRIDRGPVFHPARVSSRPALRILSRQWPGSEHQSKLHPSCHHAAVRRQAVEPRLDDRWQPRRTLERCSRSEEHGAPLEWRAASKRL